LPPVDLVKVGSAAFGRAGRRSSNMAQGPAAPYASRVKDALAALSDLIGIQLLTTAMRFAIASKSH